MTNRLNNKLAVITGGTSGIGFATAQRFIEEGARVIITGRNKERVEQAIAKLGEGAQGVVADSTSITDLQNLADTVKRRFGKLDILFANAGNGVFSAVSDVDEQSYAHQFDLNVKGVFFTVQSLLPLFTNGGSIILAASAVHQKGVPGGSLYFASKAAVRSFARSMAAEFASANIRVNSVSPGMIPTQFFANSNLGAEGYDGFAEQVIPNVPLKRPGKPVEIANAAVFLASDESSYMTAEDLVVDGGFMNV